MKKDISGTPSKFALKFYKDGKMVAYYRQTKQRDFKWLFNRANSRNFDYINLLVTYHKELNREGKMVTMHNNMDCYSIEDLKWGYKTFYKEYL